MDADERDICLYLKSWSGQFIGMTEISRRAGGKRRFRNEPDWAAQVVHRLVEKGILESDSTGHYRLKPKARKGARQARWVSPQVRQVLERSSKDFGSVIEIEDPDQFLEDLELGAQGS